MVSVDPHQALGNKMVYADTIMGAARCSMIQDIAARRPEIYPKAQRQRDIWPSAK